MNLRGTLGMGVIFIIMGLAWSSRYYYQQSADWQKQAKEASRSVRRQASELELLQQQQRALAELDERYTEKLNEAEHENAALRTQLANGHRRMYVTGDRGSVGRTSPPSASRMGHDAAIGLPAGIGQDILSIRQGIIRDQQKLMYLQNYIRQVCLCRDEPVKHN